MATVVIFGPIFFLVGLDLLMHALILQRLRILFMFGSRAQGEKRRFCERMGMVAFVNPKKSNMKHLGLGKMYFVRLALPFVC